MEKTDNTKKFSFGKIFNKTWGLRILSLFFGVLLWLYVLGAEDPYRERTLSDIPVHFEGESNLNNSQLVISSDKSEALQDVTVTVSARASLVDQINSSGLNVFVDLRNIHTPGRHTARISATSNIGAVVSIKPSVVEFDVDVLQTRTVPVQVQYIGQLPEGYWHGDCELSPATVTLTGPLNSIERVAQANCDVTLDGRNKSINESIKVTLLDENGETVSESGFIGDLPSVIVRMPVLPKKTVPLDIVGALIGIDALPSAYEVLWNRATPSSVEIAAPKETLDAINKLAIESVDLQGAQESVIKTCQIIKPSSSVVFIGRDTTEVYVEIGEKTGEVRFDDLSVNLVGLNNDLEANMVREVASITLTGPLKQTESIRRNDVKLSIDVTDRPAGTYTVPIDVTLPEGCDDVKRIITPSTITLTLTSNR